MSECRKCEYRKMCRELPKDLSCDDVKHIANCGAKMDLTQSNDSNVLNALDGKEKVDEID